MTDVYVPGTEETDLKKYAMSLQQIGPRLATAEGNITTLQTQTAGYEAAWSSYTPTVTAQTGTFTTVSATGRYKQNGKTVFAEVDVTITTAGTAAGYMSVTLPVTSASNKYVGIAFEYGATQKSGASIIAPAISTSTCLSRAADGLTMIASGNAIAIGIIYEAA